MSTFLQLCQDVCRESGTFTGTQPSSVTSQAGRLLKVVNWTANAWVKIQNLHAAWNWMRREFTTTDTVTIAETARYTPSAWSITDLAEWIKDKGVMTIYLSSLGVSDEGELEYIPWADFRYLYTIGTQTSSRPVHWSVSPDDNEFCLGPTPDAVYVVNGEYRQTAQVLAVNGDTPNLPARFHQIIVWKGVLLLGEHDEADRLALATSERNYSEDLDGLRRDQLPRVGIGAEPVG